MKYDFELSIEPHTSLGKIVRHIKEGSRVLEFGPGNGRMTNYLTTEKNCQVSIVEFDPVLFQHVMTFAADGFLGNIEEYKWCQHFDGKKFDYIVFADVLEHLTNSEKALQSTIPFIEDQGEILITFPNLAHNSVLIDLFNNRLDWKDFGLLDQTHNSFYTEAGFKKWFDSIGLYIQEQDFTYSQVGQNEIESKYEDLPERSRYDFKVRPFGEVYQYFFALTKNQPLEPVIRQPENSNFVREFFVEFQYTNGREYRPMLLNNFFGENKTVTLEFGDDIQHLRVIPADQSGCVLNFSMEINGRESRSFVQNAVWDNGETFIFVRGGEFFIDGVHLRGKTLTLHLDYIYYGRYSEIEFGVLEATLQHKKEIKELRHQLSLEEYRVDLIKERYQKANLAKTNGNQLDKRITPKETVEQLIQYYIESVEYFPDDNITVIRGWGFSKKDKKPLYYHLPADMGPYYTITRLYRKDVNDFYEIPDEKAKIGFQIEVAYFQPPKRLRLEMTTESGKKVQVRIQRDNPQNIPFKVRLRKVLGLIKRKGLKGSYEAFRMRRLHLTPYDVWRQKNEIIEMDSIKETMANFAFTPKISIVTPVYNVEEKWLEVFIQSLENQYYKNWELCLADDCSTQAHIRPMLEKYAAKDSRIKVVFREENGHISEATNSAIALASGDYIGFIDNDDELAPDALYEVVKALNENKEIDFIYTDEDKIDILGKRFDPFFKPDWNPELLLGHNYITHFVVVSREIIEKVGGLRSEYNGSQDYDFVMRCTETAEHIHHIPKILYHWRTVETSTALSPETKEYAYVAGRRAIEDSLMRRHQVGNVKMTKNYGAYKIRYRIPPKTKVSIILSGEEALMTGCVQKINEITHYSNFEILLPQGVYPLLAGGKNIRVTEATDINEIAKVAEGEFLVFLQNTLLPKNNEWLEEFVNYAYGTENGAVGGKVVNVEDVVINAGITLAALNKKQPFEQRGVSNKTLGYYFRIALPRNLYGVTEDFLCVRRSYFEEVGGFNLDLPLGIRGIDLSNRLRSQLDLRNVWEPYSIAEDHAARHLTIDNKAIQKYFDNEGSQYQQDPFQVTHSLD